MRERSEHQHGKCRRVGITSTGMLALFLPGKGWRIPILLVVLNLFMQCAVIVKLSREIERRKKAEAQLLLRP